MEATENPFALLGFDIGRAIAIASDDEELARAYRRVFGSVEGKAVLFDLMAEASMLGARPPDMPAMTRAHMDGAVSLMSKIFDRAGVSHLERVAGLQAADTLSNMERAHGNPNDEPAGPDERRSGAGTTDDGTESRFD